MTTADAQDVIILETLGIAALTTLGSLAAGKGFPPVIVYPAAGLLAVGLMGVARVDADTAVVLGGLALTGAALAGVYKGKPLAELALEQALKIGAGLKGAFGRGGGDITSRWESLGIGGVGGPVGGATSGGAAVGTAIPGSPVPGIAPHAATHETAGLPGFPAYDYMAVAGTTVVAPVDGRIERLSGKNPRLGGPPGGALGFSIYIKGDNGKRYFLTHLDQVSVRAGQAVTQGQPIAVIADGPASWSSPHVHMGISG